MLPKMSVVCRTYSEEYGNNLVTLSKHPAPRKSITPFAADTIKSVELQCISIRIPVSDEKPPALFHLRIQMATIFLDIGGNHVPISTFQRLYRIAWVTPFVHGYSRSRHPSDIECQSSDSSRIIPGAIHSTWLILNRSGFIWAGKMRAANSFGSVAESCRDDCWTTRR